MKLYEAVNYENLGVETYFLLLLAVIKTILLQQLLGRQMIFFEKISTIFRYIL